jgi:hypothetical protein
LFNIHYGANVPSQLSGRTKELVLKYDTRNLCAEGESDPVISLMRDKCELEATVALDKVAMSRRRQHDTAQSKRNKDLTRERKS